MTKIFLIVLAIPAFVIFCHCANSVAKMNGGTSELIRWSNIIISFGSAVEIFALLAVYSIDYGTWAGIKMVLSGAIMMNFGYCGLYFAERRRKIDNGHERQNTDCRTAA